MQANNTKLNGIFLVQRGYENTVVLDNKEHTQQSTIDYFVFKDYLLKSFDIEKTNKILENLNCSKKVIIDFDKNIAKVVIEKDYDFNKAMNVYFDPKYIEAELNGFGMESEEDIYSGFQLL